MRLNAEDAREQLREWREDNSRHSDDIVQIWEEGLDRVIEQFGDERWMVLEQIATAGMDTNRVDIVTECLGKLIAEFGYESIRVRRLVAMKMESEDNWDEALEILDGIIEEDEANSAARKRKIAIYKAQGDPSKTIQELNRYLRVFMSDQEAWMELCDLYVQEQEYAKAAFCCEEVLLQNPHNHLYHQRQADIRYTWGGYDQLELAKHYYSQAVKLAPSNLRALYGVLLTCSQLAGSNRCQPIKRKEFLKVAMWASKQISARYSNSGATQDNAQLALVESLLGHLEIVKCSDAPAVL